MIELRGPFDPGGFYVLTVDGHATTLGKDDLPALRLLSRVLKEAIADLRARKRAEALPGQRQFSFTDR
jgi:hypothetical protein